MAKKLTLSVLGGTFLVSRHHPDSEIPAWATGARGFSSITRTSNELSIAVPELAAPADLQAERGWRVLEVHGPFDFALTGILTAVLDPLRDAGVGIFAISTFDTDYVMVKEGNLATALAALRAAGHSIRETQ